MSDQKELQKAIALREAGKLIEAREALLNLVQTYPQIAEIQYQCAWIHDVLEREKEAVFYYEKAIELGLQKKEEQRGALLGLGSTYRCLGKYEQALQIFKQAQEQFPEAMEFKPFLAMTLYNLGRHQESTGLLLQCLASTSEHPDIKQYHKALAFYADRLDETW